MVTAVILGVSSCCKFSPRFNDHWVSEELLGEDILRGCESERVSRKALWTFSTAKKKERPKNPRKTLKKTRRSLDKPWKTPEKPYNHPLKIPETPPFACESQAAEAKVAEQEALCEEVGLFADELRSSSFGFFDERRLFLFLVKINLDHHRLPSFFGCLFPHLQRVFEAFLVSPQRVASRWKDQEKLDALDDEAAERLQLGVLRCLGVGVRWW